jgi:hypothetical protein
LLSYYCCFHITPVTSAFSGAVELTTQLLRLISILYLSLCRINKFGFYFPRRLLRSRILVGHQRHPPVDVPQRHVCCCLQWECSSTHKTSLAMVLIYIWKLWRFDVPSNVHLGGVGVWRRSLASVST